MKRELVDILRITRTEQEAAEPGVALLQPLPVLPALLHRREAQGEGEASAGPAQSPLAWGVVGVVASRNKTGWRTTPATRLKGLPPYPDTNGGRQQVGAFQIIICIDNN